MRKIYIFNFLFLFAPMFAYAQPQQSSRITEIIFGVAAIFNYFIVILMALAAVVFLWGVVSYIIGAHSGNEEKLSAARAYMIWGIIGLFCMVAVWGLVEVLINTFGLGTPYTPIAPGTP